MENSINMDIVHIDSVGSIIDDLQKLYQQDNIEGMIVSILQKDGIVMSWWSNLSFLKRLGMAENLKIVMDLEARKIL